MISETQTGAIGTVATPPKLSKLSIFGYGLGDLGTNMTWSTTTTFLLFFYTDVFGLAAASVGILFVVARVVDAITDPLMGLITERVQTRWGKFRPYLLFGAPILSGLLILTFSVPELSDGGKLVYAYVTYIALGLVYTATALPYGALSTTMTQDPIERNTLSVVRTIFALIGGGLIVSILAPVLVENLGGGSAARGWQMTAIVFSGISLICLWLTFALCKERFVSPRVNNLSLRELIGLVFKNKPFLLLALALLLSSSSLSIREAASIYFVTYNMAQPDLLAAFLGASVLALLVGLIIGQIVARKVGKRNNMLIGSTGSVACIAIFSFIPISSTVALISVNAFSTGFLGLAFSLIWSLISDTVEYSEWQTGIRAEGGIYSLASFMFKLAAAIAGGVPAAILAWTNYIPNVEQTALALGGIRSLMTIIPFVLGIATLIPLYLYRLDEAMFSRILEDLAERKKDT